MIDIHSHIIFDVDDGPKILRIQKLLKKVIDGSSDHHLYFSSQKGMFETPEI